MHTGPTASRGRIRRSVSVFTGLTRAERRSAFNPRTRIAPRTYQLRVQWLRHRRARRCVRPLKAVATMHMDHTAKLRKIPGFVSASIGPLTASLSASSQAPIIQLLAPRTIPSCARYQYVNTVNNLFIWSSRLDRIVTVQLHIRTDYFWFVEITRHIRYFPHTSICPL